MATKRERLRTYSHGIFDSTISRVGVEHSRSRAEFRLHERLRIAAAPVVAAAHEVRDPHAIHVSQLRAAGEVQLARERHAHGGLVPHERRRRRGQCAEEGQVAGEAEHHGGQEPEDTRSGCSHQCGGGFIAGRGLPASSHPPPPSGLPRTCAASISGEECVCSSAKVNRIVRRQDQRGPIWAVPDVEADVPYVSRSTDWWVFIDGMSDKEFNRMFRRYCEPGGTKASISLVAGPAALSWTSTRMFCA